MARSLPFIKCQDAGFALKHEEDDWWGIQINEIHRLLLMYDLKSDNQLERCKSICVTHSYSC